MRLISMFTPVHFFAQPVVTLIGLGIAIDYGLFIVSRFREELAEGYDTEAAVRRTVMTSGRTVVFSAVIIVASSLPLLLFPQGFLKSITYAIIASVMMAALLSITVLAAIRPFWDPTSTRWASTPLLRVPFLANWSFSRKIIDWFAEKTQKTKTREEVEHGFKGQARQPGDEAADHVRRAHHHRDDPADHSTREAGPGRHQREVPTRPTRCAWPRRVRQDLPRLPHRADHPW